MRDNVLLDTNVPPEITVIGEHSSTEKAHIWNKAKEAQDAGDEILANILLKAYRDIDKPMTMTKPTPVRSISANPILIPVGATADTAPETEVEDDLIYAIGVVTNHQDIGFTPYFDENIKKLKAPLPLTIFDRGEHEKKEKKKKKKKWIPHTNST
jgi:hypothetical protein